MYECFHCLTKGVIWDGDFDGEDYGYEEPGVVHICHCVNCGAEIIYWCPNEPENQKGANDGRKM